MTGRINKNICVVVTICMLACPVCLVQTSSAITVCDERFVEVGREYNPYTGRLNIITDKVTICREMPDGVITNTWVPVPPGAMPGYYGPPGVVMPPYPYTGGWNGGMYGGWPGVGLGFGAGASMMGGVGFGVGLVPGPGWGWGYYGGYYHPDGHHRH